MTMKKILALLLCLIMLPTLAFAEDAPEGLSYKPAEFYMPAIGWMIYIPADMRGYEGDRTLYDMGFRLNLSDEAMGFEMEVDVIDGRDMPLDRFAQFIAERNDYEQPEPLIINECYMQRAVKRDDPTMTLYILSFLDGEDDYDTYYYSILFDCDTDKAVALADEIMSTLSMN